MSDSLRNSILQPDLHDELRKSNLLKRDSVDSVHKDSKDSKSKTVEADQARLEESERKNSKFFDSEELKRAQMFEKVLAEEKEDKKREEKKRQEELELERKNKPVIGDYIKRDLDLAYVNKILSEIKDKLQKYNERDILKEDYKKLTVYVLKKLEKEKFLKALTPEKKSFIIREINRIFVEKFEGTKLLKEQVERITTYRLQDLKREVKDNSWKTKLRFLTELLRQNPHNRDLLEPLRFKKLPSDLRHIIWRSNLNNTESEREYSNLLRTDKVLTVSQFELNILSETRNFVNRHVSTEVFDASMIQCMKTILSYEEKKTDKILSDFNYMLAMPIIIAFCELRWLLSSPAELIGIYENVIKIVRGFDPVAGLRAEQDEAYEATLVEETLDKLKEADSELDLKLKRLLNEGKNNQTFALIIRKFIQSLGFSYLNVDSTLFLWDQIILRVTPEKEDIHHAFIAMLLCAKEELMATEKWSDFAEMIYLKGKAIRHDLFIAKFKELSEHSKFYKQRYEYDSIPVEDIRLNKVLYNQEAPEEEAGKSQPDQEDGTSDGKTKSQKFVEDNYDQLVANNVVMDDSKVRLPEGDGLLVNRTMLKNLNESQSKVEDDILADMEAPSRKGKKKGKKEERRGSKSSKKRKSKKDLDDGNSSKKSKSRKKKRDDSLSKKSKKKKKGGGDDSEAKSKKGGRNKSRQSSGMGEGESEEILNNTKKSSVIGESEVVSVSKKKIKTRGKKTGESEADSKSKKGSRSKSKKSLAEGESQKDAKSKKSERGKSKKKKAANEDRSRSKSNKGGKKKGKKEERSASKSNKDGNKKGGKKGRKKKGK